MESRLIGTVVRCKLCSPSKNWLGKYSPIPKIKGGKMWLAQHLDSIGLTESDLFLSDHLLATFLEQSSKQTNNTIPFTGITEVEWLKDIHLDHIIGMLHGKPFVTYFGLTLEDVKTISL